MSELHNPIFDEEKEFLERKKLEYERALRGDVDHIKEQSAAVGRVALVGAGLAGTVWLITKAFGGKKRRPDGNHERADSKASNKKDKAKGKDKDQGPDKPKSAAASAMVFIEQMGKADHEFGRGPVRPTPLAAQPVGTLTKPADKAPAPRAAAAPAPAPKAAEQPAPKAAPTPPTTPDDDPFQDLPGAARPAAPREAKRPADPAKGQPTAAMAEAPRHSIARVVGSVLQQFLQSDTGKVLVAQTAALALAAVTKKAGEFFPADKNADLADSTDVAKAPAEATPAASPAPSASPDASKSPQPV